MNVGLFILITWYVSGGFNHACKFFGPFSIEFMETTDSRGPLVFS